MALKHHFKTMADNVLEIRSFFERYAMSFNKALKQGPQNIDIDDTAGAFAEYFVEASPQGITAGKNDEQFRAMIRQGYNYYRSIGVSSMNILNTDISVINRLHFMVKVQWKSCFLKKDNSNGSIEFHVTYLLQSLKDSQYRIFAYVTGDEQAALREIGLI
jgi:hypothetical protein